MTGEDPMVIFEVGWEKDPMGLVIKIFHWDPEEGEGIQEDPAWLIGAHEDPPI